MVEEYFYGGIIKGTAAERIAYVVTDLSVGTLWIETDTPNIYDWTGTVWRLKGGQTADVTDEYSWLIYKVGSIYKAKSGILGLVPTGADNFATPTTLWTWLRSNFNQTGDDVLGGLVQFYEGKFIFTSEVLLDNAMGNTTNGIILQGHRRGTILSFEPTGAQTNGMRVASVSGTALRDLWLQGNSNVTNVLAVDASANHNTDGIYDNLRIGNTLSEARVTNQKGIYIYSDKPSAQLNSLHFNAFRNILLRWMDTAIETEVRNTANQNTSFLSFDHIRIWAPTRGIKLGDYSIEQSINDLIVQDSANNADYAVSIGAHSWYNQLRDITADGMSKTTAAAIILNEGAKFNKGSGIMNTGRDAIMDYSGSITNKFENVAGFGTPDYKGKQNMGSWDGASPRLITSTNAYGTGLFADPGSLIVINQGAGNSIDVDHFSAEDGKGITFTTGATATNMVGIRGDVYFTQRQLSPLFVARFKVGGTDPLGDPANQRLWISLLSAKANPPSSNGYHTLTPLIGLSYRNNAAGASTVFQYIGNDHVGTNAAVQTAKWPDNTDITYETTRRKFNPITNAKDVTTEAHVFWLYGDNINSRWMACLDEGAVHEISVDTPVGTQALTWQVVLETTTAAAKSFTLYSVQLTNSR